MLVISNSGQLPCFLQINERTLFQVLKGKIFLPRSSGVQEVAVLVAHHAVQWGFLAPDQILSRQNWQNPEETGNFCLISQVGLPWALWKQPTKLPKGWVGILIFVLLRLSWNTSDSITPTSTRVGSCTFGSFSRWNTKDAGGLPRRNK